MGERHRAARGGEHVDAGDSRRQAAAVDVPVLVAAAEVDVKPDLEAERASYSASPSVEAMRLEGATLVHDFANTRARLWAYLDDWGRRHAASVSESLGGNTAGNGRV